MIAVGVRHVSGRGNIASVQRWPQVEYSGMLKAGRCE